MDIFRTLRTHSTHFPHRRGYRPHAPHISRIPTKQDNIIPTHSAHTPQTISKGKYHTACAIAFPAHDNIISARFPTYRALSEQDSILSAPPAHIPPTLPAGQDTFRTPQTYPLNRGHPSRRPPHRTALSARKILPARAAHIALSPRTCNDTFRTCRTYSARYPNRGNTPHAKEIRSGKYSSVTKNKTKREKINRYDPIGLYQNRVANAQHSGDYAAILKLRVNSRRSVRSTRLLFGICARNSRKVIGIYLGCAEIARIAMRLAGSCRYLRKLRGVRGKCA